MKRALSALLVLMGIFLCLAGCGRANYSGPRRYPLSGRVTIDGQPLDVGNIAFLDPSGKSGLRPSGGPIVDGAFHVSEEMGANAGKYQVRISWQKKTGQKYKDHDSGEIYDQRKEGLPERYYSGSSELSAEVPSPNNTYDFDLTSK